MMPFADKPYTYRPPRYFGPTAWCLRAANRFYRLPRLFRIPQIIVRGEMQARDLARSGARVVIVANHSTHVDAPLLIEACRRVGMRPRTMAAYDVYERGAVDAWVLRRLGCFSVDREGSDKQALEEAARTIEHGRFPLALFPEGNVYLENDRVTPFLDGAALLAIRGAKALQERGVRVVVLPFSIKLSNLTDCTPILKQEIHGLSKYVGAEVDPSGTASEALGAIARAALSREMKGRGVDVRLDAGTDVAESVRRAADAVLGALEPKLGLETDAALDPIERVRRCRRVIHEVRLDPERAADHRVAATWAEEAMLAFRIASYAPGYVRERPSIDRIGEWIEKLHEDLHDTIKPARADRVAMLGFETPIDVTAMLESGAKQKQLIGQLTARMHAAVQAGVDASNAGNASPGASLWDSPIGARPRPAGGG